MTSMLSHPLWPLAHWTALVTGLVLVWAGVRVARNHVDDGGSHVT